MFLQTNAACDGLRAENPGLQFHIHNLWFMVWLSVKKNRCLIVFWKLIMYLSVHERNHNSVPKCFIIEI